MDLANYLSFLGAAILLTLAPGPDNMYILTKSLSAGPRQGVTLAMGLATAYASCHGRCGGFHPELAGIFHGLEILRRGLPPLSLLRRFPLEGRFDQGGRRGG